MRIRDGAFQLPQLIRVVQHIQEAEGEDADHVTRQRQQEQEEVAVVPPPDAVVHPGAVVVEVLAEECAGRERETMNARKLLEKSTVLSKHTLIQAA